jgi:hypothetical protein
MDAGHPAAMLAGLLTQARFSRLGAAYGDAMDRLTQGFKEASGAKSPTTITPIQSFILTFCQR